MYPTHRASTDDHLLKSTVDANNSRTSCGMDICGEFGSVLAGKS